MEKEVKDVEDIKLYIISYNRADTILTGKLLPNATYVVRKSQEQDYLDANIKNVWGVPDDEVGSWVAVMNYVIDNSPVELFTIMDDDIESFNYITISADKITDPEMITDELFRQCTMLCDLDLGYGFLNFTPDARKYVQEFRFWGTGGSVYFFNRRCLKSRFNEEAYAVADAELELQELLHNRIILYPKYMTTMSIFNKGKNTQSRTLKKVKDSLLWVKLKWGGYFYYENNKTKILIER